LTDSNAPAPSTPSASSEPADTIRAVVRALRLLRLMNERPVWTLHELHLASALPKATLSRLLATLRQEGYVAAEATPGLYRLAGKVRELDGGYTEGSRLVDAGRPILLRVTRQIKWPLALATLDVDAMVVRFSSMPYSPLAVHTTTLGHRLGLVDSALGRAFLAFCSDTERQALLDNLYTPAAGTPDGEDADGPEGPDLRVWSRDWVEHDLAQVRAAGCAVRQPNAARGSATLAVPVRVGRSGAGEAVAALSMTTFGRSMTAAVVERHRPILAETAQAIAAAFSAETGKGTGTG
jgi:IclR family mhp operon transcriptional activator